MINRFVNFFFAFEYVVNIHSLVLSSLLFFVNSASMIHKIFCRCFNRFSLSSFFCFFLRMTTWRNFWSSSTTIFLTISFVTSRDNSWSKLRDVTLSSFDVSLEEVMMIDKMIVLRFWLSSEFLDRSKKLRLNFWNVCEYKKRDDVKEIQYIDIMRLVEIFENNLMILKTKNS